MRNIRCMALLGWLVLTLPLLLAMGGVDSEGLTRIPEPSADYHVCLTDQEGARVELTAFAIDGQTFVLGQVGQGQVAVPFERVKMVELANKGGQLKARVAFKDGEPVELTVKAALKATGKTRYGNFRIPLGGVRAVEFLGRTR
jgi:hypothetical protein